MYRRVYPRLAPCGDVKSPLRHGGVNPPLRLVGEVNPPLGLFGGMNPALRLFGGVNPPGL